MYFIVTFHLALLALATSQDESALASQIAKCRSIENDIARLLCFDTATSSAKLDEPSEVETTSSEWQTNISTDPLTDATTVVLALVDDARKAMLVLRCANKKTHVFINWNDYLGSEAIVTSRLGDEKATRKEWGLSTNKKATFYPGKDSDLIKGLMRSERFVVQVTPYNENPVTAVFDVAGLRDVVQPLLDTCEIN